MEPLSAALVTLPETLTALSGASRLKTLSPRRERSFLETPAKDTFGRGCLGIVLALTKVRLGQPGTLMRMPRPYRILAFQLSLYDPAIDQICDSSGASSLAAGGSLSQ